jgi:hypothetical protein
MFRRVSWFMIVLPLVVFDQMTGFQAAPLSGVCENLARLTAAGQGRSLMFAQEQSEFCSRIQCFGFDRKKGSRPWAASRASVAAILAGSR